MAIGRDKALFRDLHTLFDVGAIGELTDGQLLERFAADRGKAAEFAFQVLVERHGPMVLRVCRGVLADAHEAQDAFQATFLVLVGRARTLWVRDSLGPWLHQVAYRTASCARSAAARRRRHERAAAERTGECRVGPESEREDELGSVLHQEIDRLPERFRAPVVLCDLEGGTHEQAARHLGWPIGTVKSRLSRGRNRLRDCLIRRGVAPSVWPLARALRLDVVEASIFPALVRTTVENVIRWSLSRSVIRESAATLAQEVLRSMTMIRWLKGASLVLVLAATVSGVDRLAQRETPVARAAELPASEVKRGPLTNTIVQRGVIETARFTTAFSKVEGKTTIVWLVPEGTMVKKGDLICRLDSSALKDGLADQRVKEAGAEAAFRKAGRGREAAETALVAYLEGTHAQEMEALNGAIELGQAAIRRAEARLERTRRARQRWDQARESNAKTVTAAELVAEVELDDRIDAAEQAVLGEKQGVELARRKRDVLGKYTRQRMVNELQADIETKRSEELAEKQEWDLEKSKIARMEEQIESCDLYASSDGGLEYANDPSPRDGLPQIEEGAVVRERQNIFKVHDLEGPMRIRVRMPEAIVDQVRPGLHARIKADFSPNEVMTGAVESVAPLPDPPSMSRTNEKVYSTNLIIEKHPPGLRPGMVGNAEILVFELDDVLSVPLQAVLPYDDKDHVAITKLDGGFEWREVTLGRSNGKFVEVKQGLEGGERVVERPIALMSEEEQRIKFGSPVRPTPPARRPPATRPAVPNDPARTPARR